MWRAGNAKDEARTRPSGLMNVLPFEQLRDRIRFEALSDDMGTISLQLEISGKSSAVEKCVWHRRRMVRKGRCMHACNKWSACHYGRGSRPRFSRRDSRLEILRNRRYHQQRRGGVSSSGTETKLGRALWRRRVARFQRPGWGSQLRGPWAKRPEGTLDGGNQRNQTQSG